MAVVQLLGPEQPRIDGLPETIETIAAQLSQYADRKRSDATAARMKDQFVSTVSHELRTPLAAMDGWLHILLDGEPGPLNEEQHRFLTTVKRNSDRLMRLVGDLLLIGQMDAGRFTLDMGDVDIARAGRRDRHAVRGGGGGEGGRAERRHGRRERWWPGTGCGSASCSATWYPTRSSSPLRVARSGSGPGSTTAPARSRSPTAGSGSRRRTGRICSSVSTGRQRPPGPPGPGSAWPSAKPSPKHTAARSGSRTPAAAAPGSWWRSRCIWRRR